ncbi:MAG: hypothetical protein Q7S49_00200 [bacterium]|nr:hypothetical protein [bacterium]
MSLVTFQYNLGKDADNFIRGTQSVNSKQPTKLQEEYELLFGKDFSLGKVEQFLKERANRLQIRFQQKALEFAKGWKPLEKNFTLRCEALFNIELKDLIIVFLSQNQRCTYRWRENYFFLYYDSDTPNKTVMHELLHFYTHRKYGHLRLDSKKFNDIKESLTVLLNTDFSDLMAGTEDGGYSQHEEMRWDIIKMRKERLSVDEIVENLT